MKKLHFFIVVLVLLIPALAFSTGEKEKGAKTGTAEEPVTIEWWDWHDSMVDYTKATIQEFERRNPGIKVEYTLQTISNHNQAVTLAARSGDMPDIAGKPTNMLFGQAVDSGWFQPVNKYVEELWPGGFEAFVARYPEDAYMEGLNMINGDIYTFPKQYPAGYTALMYYNKGLMEEAGLDPETAPRTWGEVRDAAAKITTAGNGQYYGFIEGGNQLNRWQASAQALGAVHGGIELDGLDYRDGKYAYDNGSYEAGIRWMKSVQDDGSYYPGYLSIDAREARALYGLDKAGFLIQGHWCIGVWQKDNPDLDFGVMYPPVPDSGRGGYVYAVPMAYTVEWMLTEEADHPEEAMKYWLYRTSDEWYQGYVKSGDGFAPFPELNKKENFPFPQLYDVFVGAQTDRRLAPLPQLRNPEGVSAVFAEFKSPTPGIREITQGFMTGQVTDLTGQLAELTQKLNEELDRAVAAAKAKGADVSRLDFTFPNWVIGEDYSAADYEELE